jgi:Domain of unknown function (DUF1707)/Cell wall-active antibiotics response 4TMS YvqF
MQAQAGDPGHDAVRRPDPSRLRISDQDRHKVAEVLREAAGEGRIDLDELDQRLEAAYSAKTYAELVPITADLPAAHRGPAPSPRPAGTEPAPGGAHFPTSIAVMSETKRSGAWTVGDRHSAVALMGSVVLDLRQAQFGSRELTINANAVMGEVRILVNAGTTVVVEGIAVMGEYSEQRSRVPFDPAQGGPVLRVRGLALMGAVRVQRKGPPGRGLPRRLASNG